MATHPSHSRPYPNLPSNVKHYQRKFRVGRIPAAYHWAIPNAAAAAPTIAYSDFRGTGPPPSPPTFGVDGDFYLDKTVGAHSLYYFSGNRWKSWKFPKEKPTPKVLKHVHPAFKDEQTTTETPRGPRAFFWEFPIWYFPRTMRVKWQALSSAGLLSERHFTARLLEGKVTLPRIPQKRKRPHSVSESPDEESSHDDDNDHDEDEDENEDGDYDHHQNHPSTRRLSRRSVHTLLQKPSSTLPSNDEQKAAEDDELRTEIVDLEDKITKLQRSHIDSGDAWSSLLGPGGMDFFLAGINKYFDDTDRILEEQIGVNEEKLAVLSSKLIQEQSQLKQEEARLGKSQAVLDDNKGKLESFHQALDKIRRS